MLAGQEDTQGNSTKRGKWERGWLGKIRRYMLVVGRRRTSGLAEWTRGREYGKNSGLLGRKAGMATARQGERVEE